MKERVLVAMSGGVDSSVTAWLLQQQGYECIGITMKLYHGEDAPGCSAPDDAEDARLVAERLGMPFHIFDCTRRFDEAVIQKFAASYAAGETPNPCIDCNRHLKFGALMQRAQELGCTYLATGHYAVVASTEDGRRVLRKAADLSRDQSYVLASITPHQLQHILFPLGTLQKTEVRRIAEEQGFCNARKHDSQDICFVPDGDYTAFLTRYTGISPTPGPIVDQTGKVRGQHRGAIRYTIGQHKGLGISSDIPLYVCEKSMEDNTIVVGPSEVLFSRELLADDLVWSGCDAPTAPISVLAKVRYRQTEQPATVFPLPDGRVRVVFDQPQRAITVGQALVLYQGDTVLAGGTIRSVAKPAL